MVAVCRKVSHSPSVPPKEPPPQRSRQELTNMHRHPAGNNFAPLCIISLQDWPAANKLCFQGRPGCMWVSVPVQPSRSASSLSAAHKRRRRLRARRNSASPRRSSRSRSGRSNFCEKAAHAALVLPWFCGPTHLLERYCV